MKRMAPYRCFGPRVRIAFLPDIEVEAVNLVLADPCQIAPHLERAERDLFLGVGLVEVAAGVEDDIPAIRLIRVLLHVIG